MNPGQSQLQTLMWDSLQGAAGQGQPGNILDGSVPFDPSSTAGMSWDQLQQSATLLGRMSQQEQGAELAKLAAGDGFSGIGQWGGTASALSPQERKALQDAGVEDPAVEGARERAKQKQQGGGTDWTKVKGAPVTGVQYKTQAQFAEQVRLLTTMAGMSPQAAKTKVLKDWGDKNYQLQP